MPSGHFVEWVRRQFRLGLGVLGSIPGWLLILAAFVVLAVLRFVSLTPSSTKSETEKGKGRKVVRMAQKLKLLWPAGIETVWAVGASMLAGSPLST